MSAMDTRNSRRLLREGKKQGADPNLLKRCHRQQFEPRQAQIAVAAMTSVHAAISRHSICRQPAFVPTCHQRRQRLSQHFSGRRHEQNKHSAVSRPRCLRVSAIAQEALTTPALPPARTASGTVFVSGAHCDQDFVHYIEIPIFLDCNGFMAKGTLASNNEAPMVVTSLCTGASGPIGARLIRELLRAGFDVTGGAVLHKTCAGSAYQYNCEDSPACSS